MEDDLFQNSVGAWPLRDGDFGADDAEDEDFRAEEEGEVDDEEEDESSNENDEEGTPCPGSVGPQGRPQHAQSSTWALGCVVGPALAGTGHRTPGETPAIPQAGGRTRMVIGGAGVAPHHLCSAADSPAAMWPAGKQAAN